MNTQPEALRLAEQYNHGVCNGAIALGTGCMRCERCADQLAARIAELEAELEAVGAGGVQALSAPAEADMFWDAEDGERFGNDIDDIISDFGPGDRVKINCAKRMPSIEVLVVADGDDLTYRIVSPTPPAEQKACDTQLFKFYGVSTTAELIAAQARHIEKLQAKIPPTPSFAPQRVREG